MRRLINKCNYYAKILIIVMSLLSVSAYAQHNVQTEDQAQGVQENANYFLPQQLPPPRPISPDESRILSSILNPKADRYSIIQERISKWQIVGVIGDVYFIVDNAYAGASGGESIFPIPKRKEVMRKYGCNFNYPFIECREIKK